MLLQVGGGLLVEKTPLSIQAQPAPLIACPCTSAALLLERLPLNPALASPAVV